MVTETTNHTHTQSTPISGSMAFFLWIGLGLSSLSVVYSAYVLHTHLLVQFTWWFLLLFILLLSAKCICAVATIWAFYKVKSYAVPLAYASIIIIFWGGLLDLVISFLGADFWKGGVTGILWSFLWFAYLKCSCDVENRFEGVKSRWSMPVLLLLLVYITARTLFFFCLFLFTLPMLSNPLIEKRSAAKRMLEDVNQTLPYIIEDGLIFKNISMDEDTIVLDFKYVQMSADSVKTHLNNGNLLFLKQKELYGISRFSKDKATSLSFITDNGFHLRYHYLSQYGELINVLRITPQEFQNARTMGTDFHIDSLTRITLLEQIQVKLPQSFLDNYQMQAVSVNLEERTMEIVIQMPVDNIFDLLPSESLYQYLKKRRYALAQYIPVQMAVIDKMNINFKFLRPDGTEFTTLEMSYRVFL